MLHVLRLVTKLGVTYLLTIQTKNNDIYKNYYLLQLLHYIYYTLYIYQLTTIHCDKLIDYLDLQFPRVLQITVTSVTDWLY